jgi:uncharacterized protein (DUF433 family)
MSGSYVENRDGDYWIADTRVSLDSVVHAYWEGYSPETIAQSFSALSLEQVYGAIAYYLHHREAVDASIQKAEAIGEALRRTCDARIRRSTSAWLGRRSKSRLRRHDDQVSSGQ